MGPAAIAMGEHVAARGRCVRWLEDIAKPSKFNASQKAALVRPPTTKVERQRRVWAMMVFAYELPMLTLHMRIVQHEVHGFLVSESTTTYASVNKRIWEPNKRAVLSEALASNAFPADLAAKTNITRLSVGTIRSFCSGHSLPGSQGCYEAGHYYALYKLLLRVAAPGDLAYLSDVDEVASPHALRMLRQCAPFYGDDGPGGGSAWAGGTLSGHSFQEPPMYVLRAWELKYGVHCWGGSSPADQPSWILGPHVFSVSFLMEHADRIGPMEFRDSRLKMQGTFP